MRKLLLAIILAIIPSAVFAAANPANVLAVPSMAVLSSYPAIVMQQYGTFQLNGYYAGSTAGGGTFTWLTAAQASGLTPDGGVVIAPSDRPTDCSEGCLVRVDTTNLTPADFGAKTDGSSDASAQIVAASSWGPVNIMPGQVYLVSNSVSVGRLDNKGGLINIASGVTLTFSDVVGDPATSIFEGDGIAVSQKNTYSVGWYAGSAFQDKWNFMLRGMRNFVFKTVDIPQPHAGDPAAIEFDPSRPEELAWNVTGTVNFDDTTTNYGSPSIDDTKITVEGTFYVSSSVTDAFKFSATAKIEDVAIYGPFIVYGNDNTTNSLMNISAGARVQFHGTLELHDSGAGTALIIGGGVDAVDELYLPQVLIVGYDNAGVIIHGVPSGIVADDHIGLIASSGGNSGCTNDVVIEGVIRYLTIDNIYHNNGAGEFDCSGPIVHVLSTADGSPAYGNEIGSIYNYTGNQEDYVSEKSGGSSASMFKLGRLSAPVSTNPLASFLNDFRSSWEGPGDGATRTYQAIVDSASSKVSINNVPPDAVQITDAGSLDTLPPNLKIDGRYQLSVTLNSDTAIAWNLSDHPYGLITVVCTGDANQQGVATLINGSVLTSVSAGTLAAWNSSTALTGTTGTSGSLNIGALSNNVYIENYTAAARTYRFELQ